MTAIVRSQVERYLRVTGMKPSRFGRTVTGDSRLVIDLRNGRELRPKLQTRILNYLAQPEVWQPARSRQRPVWSPEKDDQLWNMVAAGTCRKIIAEVFQRSPASIGNRVAYLADERLFMRPRHMRLVTAIQLEAA